MTFEIGHKVKVRLPGGTTWPGVVKGKREVRIGNHGSTVTEYQVLLENTGVMEYYRGYDLISDVGKEYIHGAGCTCGAASTYAPKDPPGHAFHCDLARNKRLIQGVK